MSKRSVRQISLKVLQILFVTTFGAFFVVAILMVLGQLLGTVLSQPALVSAASEYLLVPSVSLASIFGVIAFLASYLETGTTEGQGA